MAGLILEQNIARPDDIFQLLVALHDGCDEQESLRRSARLILLLANHVGDEAILRQAVRIASTAGEGASV